ncbi:hypothetical protein AAFF_G00313740 [Aldrovandia affinis]|uniref:Apolipoprotein M n=1 Tax=Aldrovandia affinis TaxID=143900 RepID=A0AAD7W0R0_9TELE|nr:hypothetical protein AAFF_G00313740 [Aldrovandia affinis]
MLGKVWSLVLYVYGLFQGLWPCPGPQQLSVNHLASQRYQGTWYFIAAAGRRPSDIQQFTEMDNSVYHLQEATEDGTILLTGAYSLGHESPRCFTQAWTYHLLPDKEYLDLEGHPDRRTIFWSGEWLNCPDCIMMNELDLGEVEDKLSRIMLYARNSSLSSDIVQDFQSKWTCLGVKDFLILPRRREYCQLDGVTSI